MKSINDTGNTFLLSTNGIPLSFLKYQLVFQIQDNLKYVKSFNILMNNKILKKYYLDEMVLIDDSFNVEMIISNSLTNDTMVKSPKSRITKSSKKKVDSDARTQAASEILSNFGL